MFRESDSDGSGGIDVEEFVKLVRHLESSAAGVKVKT
jgi:Ca2+-binding EF-hand superfamily protein